MAQPNRLKILVWPQVRSIQPDNKIRNSKFLSIRSMWKSLLLGLLVSLHTRIFLVFMRNYEAKSPLFMIKRAGLNYVPRQSYSKNSHGSYILKWILVLNFTNQSTFFLHFIGASLIRISFELLFERLQKYESFFIFFFYLKRNKPTIVSIDG